MPKNTSKTKVKQLRKERAAKRARKKRIIIAGFSILVILIIVGLVVFLSSRPDNAEVYGNHGQTVRLYDDGNFTARLPHNVRKNGTYTRTIENDLTIIEFTTFGSTTEGSTETGWIIENSLHIPREWDDGHGHGSVFPRVN
jgi:hypothetical protein